MPKETRVEKSEVVVTLRLRFKPGTIEPVLARMLPIAMLTRQEDGNVSFDVFRARDHADELVILERWRDQAALERHWQEPYTKEVLALFEANLASPLSEADDVTYLQDLLPEG